MRDEYEFEFLLKMYEECQSQRRHHETYRAKLTETLAVIYTALLAAMSSGMVNVFILSLALLVISVFGLIATISYTERYVFYWRRSQLLRKQLDAEYARVDIEKLYSKAKLYRKEDDEAKWPNKIPELLGHHKIWMWFHVVAIVISLFIIIYSGYNDLSVQSIIINNEITLGNK